MRATKYDDGIKRIKAKIEVPMCEHDISNYILSALTSNVVDLSAPKVVDLTESAERLL